MLTVLAGFGLLLHRFDRFLLVTWALCRRSERG